jgi:5-methyltetrahydropteroyltriglutamate--homocysteine methyltransferase
MKRSQECILTTHTGSLPRPVDLLDLLWAKEDGKTGADEAFRSRLPSAVSEIVQAQSESGIDVPSDGELGKTSFFNYVVSRIDGFETVPSEGSTIPPAR